MKNRFIKLIFIGFALLLVGLAFPLSNKNVVFADEYTPISSAEDFVSINENITGNFVLSDDIVLSCEQTVDVFSGTFNGNGHTITVNGLFSIFGNLENANVSNLKIKFVNEDEVPTLTNNFGLLASQMTSSIINTIECDFTIINTETTLGNTESFTTLQSVDISVEGSYNIGGLIGKTSGGEIKNCVVFSKLNVTELDASASFINVGGLVGYSENTNIHNVVLNANNELSHNDNSNNTKLSNGGIVGYLTGNQTKLKNIVVDGSIIGAVGSFLGTFVGSLSDNSSQLPSIENNQINGLVSTLTLELDGFGKNNYLTKDTHYKTSQKKNDYQKIDVYNSTEFWDNEPSNIWNTDSIWKEGLKYFENGQTDNRYLIILQCFENFVVQVDNSPNTHSLGENCPSENILDLTISIDDKIIDDKYAQVPYGKTIKITASFKNIYNNEQEVLDKNQEPMTYDVFFEIQYFKLGMEILTDIEFDEDTLTWTVPFMKKSYEGTYTVTLKAKTYNLLATTVTPDGDVQGKISGSRTSTINHSEISYQFSYGKTITFYSIAERYFASAGFDFYPSKDKEEGSGKEFDYENVKSVNLDTCNESMFTFRFVESDLFTINYLFSSADFSSQNEVVGYVNSVFSNNVCEIYFEFELDGEITDEMFGMRIYASGEQLQKTNDILVKKVIRGNDITISLAGFPDEEFKFVTIRDDFGNEYLIDGETTFDYNSGDLETVVFTLCIETLEDGKGNGAIWWIIGGVTAGILAIVVCWILIVKFKDNSYRNMYNKF